MLLIVILIAVGAALLLGLILLYNRLVRFRNRVDNAWAQIDVQLRRRYDLIPNLVETVKGYAAHERQTFDSVTRARAEAIGAGSVAQQAEAETMITRALRSLFAVAEAYPELQADENFAALQAELSATESRIAFARQFYNDSVLKLNTAIQVVPTNVVASLFRFKARDYFEADEVSRGPVEVDFTNPREWGAP